MPDLLKILTLAAGVTGVLGFVSLVGVLALWGLAAKPRQSLEALFLREGIVSPGEAIRILKLFKDDASRLEALKALLQGDGRRAKLLLEQVNAAPATRELLRLDHKRNILVVISGVFLLGTGVALAAFDNRLQRTDPPPASVPPPAQCEAGQTRCHDDQYQTCDPSSHQWSVVPCGAGQSCLDLGGGKVGCGSFAEPGEPCDATHPCRSGQTCAEQVVTAVAAGPENDRWIEVHHFEETSIFGAHRTGKDGDQCPAGFTRTGAPGAMGSGNSRCEAKWHTDSPQDCTIEFDEGHGPGHWHCIVQAHVQRLETRSAGFRCQ